MKIDKQLLGVAGKYAVSSELCRRNIYAQLTLGKLKSTDILVFGDSGGMARIDVKSKQGSDWPNCFGISQPDQFLVFVDFEEIEDSERPNFYILSLDDWNEHLEHTVKDYLTKHPDRQIIKDDNNVLVWLSEINSSGKPYRGCGVKAHQIEQHNEAWHKISEFLDRGKK